MAYRPTPTNSAAEQTVAAAGNARVSTFDRVVLDSSPDVRDIFLMGERVER
ncbi:hypothetical protein [Umezawaea sp. Da 62-37]|uniref:hypothetical protein n=1 Tax=Umezawaea sp. Da 62-37 TaxID=3075927 RepID=UPI0028F7278F|nr:hypothetical protein [Umezawaea sp. Da 62-37]WNV87488.1 hypothetical protein RM788_04065 [Umezawaea sp. Da 62-37]